MTTPLIPGDRPRPSTLTPPLQLDHDPTVAPPLWFEPPSPTWPCLLVSHLVPRLQHSTPSEGRNDPKVGVMSFYLLESSPVVWKPLGLHRPDPAVQGPFSNPNPDSLWWWAVCAGSGPGTAALYSHLPWLSCLCAPVSAPEEGSALGLWGGACRDGVPHSSPAAHTQPAQSPHRELPEHQDSDAPCTRTPLCKLRMVKALKPGQRCQQFSSAFLMLFQCCHRQEDFLEPG